ncbi:MAG: efflux RND transporter periplasmic adaptor subunit [Acidobacteriia bacterium]|nr:efflux RND transporter periplasmic adaptor subunit [Terriglobia bacterium]
MTKTAHSILLVTLAAGGFLAGNWYHQQGAPVQAGAAPSRKILHYVCPMHPQYTSDKPGVSPCCGMRLEPVYESGEKAAGEISTLLPPGAVDIGPAQQQRIGVRVGAVERSAGTHTLRLFGAVVPAENNVYKLNAGIEGHFRAVSDATTGSLVKKDEWLATFFASDARSAIQTFIVTIETVERQKKSGADNPLLMKIAVQSADQAAERLITLGMSPVQIAEIRRTRETPNEIRITAPVNGFVIARNVSLGQRFDKGEEWYRIADLSKVWILADVFENDARYLRPGARVQVSLPGRQTTLSATVDKVLPQFDGATRTSKVRLVADNPGYVLRPAMFVDVAVSVAFPPTLSVPADAVLDTGLARTVFVDRGNGIFEPRPVETGWRFSGRIEIVKGLAEGERIAVSGGFLLDSESRIRLGAAGAGQGKR